MYENESIFDKFRMNISPDNNTVLTGNYNSWFHMLDSKSGANYQYECSYKKQTIVKQVSPNKIVSLPKMDYYRKIQACDFNPKKNQVALACWNSFFIYSLP